MTNTKLFIWITEESNKTSNQDECKRTYQQAVDQITSVSTEPEIDYCLKMYRNCVYQVQMRKIINSYARTTLKLMCISVYCVKLWNYLDNNLKCCPNIIQLTFIETN